MADRLIGTAWFNAATPQAWPQPSETKSSFETVQWSQSWDQVPKTPQKLAIGKAMKKNTKPEVKAPVIVQPPQQPATIEDELSKQNLYKTELCRSFGETGSCRYGHKCQFAHGSHELRPVLRHPKYKTETCKTFSITGTCPYGNRCRFIHPGAMPSKAQLDHGSLQSVQWSNSWAPQGSTQFATGSVMPFSFTAPDAATAAAEEDDDSPEGRKSRLAIFQELTTH